MQAEEITAEYRDGIGKFWDGFLQSMAVFLQILQKKSKEPNKHFLEHLSTRLEESGFYRNSAMQQAAMTSASMPPNLGQI